MNDKVIKDTEPQRNEALTWDLTRLYSDETAWQAEFEETRTMAVDFARFAGILSQNCEMVLEALQAQSALNQRVERLYTYAMLRLDEDTAKASSQAMQNKALSLAAAAAEHTSFFMPELVALPEEEIAAMADDPRFAAYDVLLREALRQKPHILSPKEERLMAMTTEMAAVPEQTARLLMGADLDLGTVRGEQGERLRLTEANYLPLVSSSDRAVRRRAYRQLMLGYNKLGNTFASLYAGQIKGGIFESRARGYTSCRAAALYPDQVDEAVYDSLIEAVHGGIDTLSVYLNLRRQTLGLPRMHMFDLYAEEKECFSITPSVEEAFRLFLQSVAPLGTDYVETARRAFAERWIDWLPESGKRSGAYSAGVYGRPPYVLLNYKASYDGLSTLCHEMGHAMHTYYSQENQPYAKADYTIFVAEVASTTNEILLNEFLREQYAADPAAQRALIGNLLEHFRTTVFRQTLFAEFELRAHRLAEAGESLTRESLNALYRELNETYYGQACQVDDVTAYEWMRIPHFYSPFYVYKYATGFCAAAALARNILSGDPEKVERYRRFLTLGGSMPPIEELKIAGVDMSSPEPVCEALDYFADLVMAYQQLTEKA